MIFDVGEIPFNHIYVGWNCHEKSSISVRTGAAGRGRCQQHPGAMGAQRHPLGGGSVAAKRGSPCRQETIGISIEFIYLYDSLCIHLYICLLLFIIVYYCLFIYLCNYICTYVCVYNIYIYYIKIYFWFISFIYTGEIWGQTLDLIGSYPPANQQS